jgi:hypothetical protein
MKHTLALISLFAILLSACNFPTEQDTGLTMEQQAATLVAQTLTAVAEETSIPLASPTAKQEEQPTASPTGTAGAATLQPNVTPTALTGTPSATILTVDSNTNCRQGPGQTYAIVIVLVPGTQYQMIGRTEDNKYWIVTEIGKANPCWVPAEMSNAFGNVNQLPVTTPGAPTSAAGPLQAPGALRYQYDCVYNGIPGNIQVLLQWSDRSNGELGFRIYRDGLIVGEVPANTTTYADYFTGSTTVTYSYRVSSYNAAGEALGGTISFSCQ